MSLSKQKSDEIGDTCPIAVEMEVPETVNTVFGIAELREMIIRLLIYKHQNNKFVICRKTVRCLRLVSKDWLLGITKTLNVDKKHLFHLEMNEFNSLTELQFKNRKLLDDYMDRVYSANTSSTWNKELKPLFSLKIMDECFLEENYSSLLNCFEKCGNELLKLKMLLPVNGVSMVCDFPNVTLPALNELKISLVKTLTNAGETAVTNITHLLSSLLNASSGLKTISMSNKYCQHQSLPDNFHLLKLPQTIANLEFNCNLTNLELGMLVRHPLPNLSTFKLYVPSTQFTKGLIYQVLDNHKTTLKTLYLTSNSKEQFLQMPIFPIDFPELNKLQVLQFSGLFCQLEREATSLERLFAKLEKLHLSQTERCFRTWTNSTFAQVKDLQFDILEFPSDYDVGVFELEPDPVFVNLENMQLLNRAFPNVTILKLNMYGICQMCQTCGIKYLFMEMRHLRELKLRLDGLENCGNSIVWDALLVGTTVEMMVVLKQLAVTENMVQLENNTIPSIRMLEELEKLELVDTDRISAFAFGFQPLISDLAFTHAFLKMPKLTALYFEGRFKPSDRMLASWRKNKGSISYYNISDCD